ETSMVNEIKQEEQELEVYGRVVDMNEIPLSGVNITINETTRGTQTDFDGNYSIKAARGETLKFSFVGFEDQTIKVEDGVEINITMREGSVLNEVVVTALRIKKDKKAVGYSVQDIKGEALEEMNKSKEPNILSNLTGEIAGLTIRNTTDIFQDPKIDLRGKIPLLVVDGVPDRTGDYWKINSDEIENISVLKGPSASALYGSVGRDGAIMITTKKGEKGKM